MSGHTIARLKPSPVERIITPQCCVPMVRNPAVPSVYWKHRKHMDEPKGFDSNHCAHSSAYVIDGKHYCARHAGQIALSILLTGGTARPTDQSVAV